MTDKEALKMFEEFCEECKEEGICICEKCCNKNAINALRVVIFARENRKENK